MDQKHLQQALVCVREGGVIAYPTEAVWGLGCDPSNEKAIERILELKQRDWRKGLVIVAADLEQLSHWLLPLSTTRQQQLDDSWPGPVSWILPCREQVSPLLRGEHQSLAVRVSAHPLVSELCIKCGPLVSTSANSAGHAPALSSTQVKEYFPAGIDLIVPGSLGGREQPSDIRTFDGQRIR